MVNRNTIRADLVAGLTGAILGLPQGVAFAILAGLPPEYGLYAAMLPPALSALFGSSLQMVAGPTNAVAILLFASLTHLAPAGSPDYIRLVLTVTLLTGVIELVMGIARLGALVNFISHTVIIGFNARGPQRDDGYSDCHGKQQSPGPWICRKPRAAGGKRYRSQSACSGSERKAG